ncbi:MAG: porphobilinogen synthase [Planctomycetes bacterium]|nr:porphobilinogen synthase [Planctomycetota bacterium]
MTFPSDRPRRLRRTPSIRRMVRETDVLPRHLIQPLFVEEGKGVRRPIETLPGQMRYSPDTVGEAAAECADLGIPCVLLFGIPKAKDEEGSAAWDERGVVQDAAVAIRAASADIVIAADLCLCEYTSHGHCGVLEHGVVQNDATLELLERVARSYASAGVDIIAPSGMMDGTINGLRVALDEAGWDEIALMAYAVKYASAFYGPFRAAAESTPQEGDRKGYQMDPANVREGIREAALDDEEGADILMVKPAGPYLDVIAAVRAKTQKPVAAYQVSGEYAMLKFAAAQGLIDGRAAMWESVRGIRRAGADLVITYFARELAREFREHRTT